MNIKKLILGITIWLLLVGLIFAVSYLPLSSSKTVSAPFLKNSDATKAIIFFGFTHCNDVCPTTLAVLREVVQQQKMGTPLAQVVFVDIDKTTTQQQASLFAQQFHPSFIGYVPTAEEFSALTQDFGLNIRQKNQDITHRGRTYLLVKLDESWKLVKTFNPQSLSSLAILKEIKK